MKRMAKSLGNPELCEALMVLVSKGTEINSSILVERLSLCGFPDVSGSAELGYLSVTALTLESAKPLFV
jgi:hypothetical protein